MGKAWVMRILVIWHVYYWAIPRVLVNTYGATSTANIVAQLLF